MVCSNWSSIRNNSLLVNSQETQTNFTPSFADIQTNINFQASAKWQWSFLGNISQNKYQYQPLTRQTNFGLDNPMALTVFFEGQEKDKYDTYFGALKQLLNASIIYIKIYWFDFHTLEQEYFDILLNTVWAK
jgi:hypothetical protein